MSYVDIPDAEDLPELELLDDGAEVKLRIKTAELGTSKKSVPRLEIVLEDASNPLVDDIYHYVNMPSAEQRAQDEKKYIKAVKYFKEFLECFGINASKGFETEEIIGAEGWCIVGAEEYEGRKSNKIKAYVKSR